MYQALYRKWRPLTFSDVVGQEHVSVTLQSGVKSNKIAHAYLFSGTRGTGKTSVAKIFARAVNCTAPEDGNPCNKCDSCVSILDGSNMDVYEMDAASNNGVDNIRDIRDEVAYAPAGSKYKVYIIDEVHMLSAGAFNALLKTLEEPPAHVIFILATTEPHKIPATILSRCQRFDFRRIKVKEIVARVRRIVDEEGVSATDDAVSLIAELADGSMRDGLSILEQCVASVKGELTYDSAAEAVGIADKQSLFDIAGCVADGDAAGGIVSIARLAEMGREVMSLFEDLLVHYRNLLICKTVEDFSSILDKSDEDLRKYREQAEKYSREGILYCMGVLGEQLQNARRMASPAVALELAVVKMADPRYGADLAGVLARIERLEAGVVDKSGDKAENTSRRTNAQQPTEMFDPTVKEGAVLGGSTGSSCEDSVEGSSSERHFSASTGESSSGKGFSALASGVEWVKWAEALEVIKEESKQLYAFLYPAKVYESGAEVEVVLKNRAAYGKVGTDDGVKYLGELFSRVSGEERRVTVTLDEGGAASSIGDITSLKDKFGDKMVIE